MLTTGIEMIKRAAEDNNELQFTLYDGQSKHNDMMLGLMSILDDTEHGFTVVEKVEGSATLQISQDAVKYIHNKLSDGLT